MARANWGENTRRDLEALAGEDDAVVVFPTGAIEQHGAHLPVYTDALVAERVAREAADRTDRTLALPTLPFGYSPHHSGVPGTVSLTSGTLLSVVSDVFESLVEDGFDRIAVLNGHGGNRSLLKTAASDFRDDRGVSVAVVTYWDLVRDDIERVRTSDLGGVSHAGELETSLVLYLREHLVGDDRNDYVRSDAGGYRRTDLFGSGPVYYPEHFDDMTETGVSGNPSEASVETGERIFERSVEELVTFLEAFREW